ncbi:hypothetical protein PG993_015009 [Apiospora rasikravindrae]|uniref:Uncharacterized protein n=1 Tax=Apiospora rasikravindrae TaxID=990691 RepID=A0ABR1RQU6_9PEZI
MSRLTGAWPARRFLARPSAIGCIRTPRAGPMCSPNGFPRALQAALRAYLTTASNPRAASSPRVAGDSPSAPATSANPAERGSRKDLSQLDMKNLKQSFFRFDTDVPVDTDPRSRRRWFWGYVVLNAAVTLGYACATMEMDRKHKKLEVDLGQFVDPEEYMVLVGIGAVRENKLWRFYQHHVLLSDNARGDALFTHMFMNSKIAVPVKDLIMLSVFSRAAWVAGFGRVGTPLVAVCSGVAGGLAFLWTKNIREGEVHVGPVAMVSGLMTAATVARPRMPFFIGFTPAAFPLWALCLVGFTPDLLQWLVRSFGYPQKVQEKNQEERGKASMLQKQHEQAVANRAAELRKQGGNQVPKMGEQQYDGGQQSPVAAGSQDPSGPPREGKAPREEDRSSEEASPQKETVDGEEKSTGVEGSHREALGRIRSATQLHMGPGRDAAPHSGGGVEGEKAKAARVTARLEPSLGGAACGAVMGLVLRMVLRR